MINKGQQKLYGEVEEIRRRYAQNAVVVEGKGNWAALPGVSKIESAENGRKGALLYLQPGTTPEQVLAAMVAAPDTHIERFELAVPDLNDIFIRVVEGEAS